MSVSSGAVNTGSGITYEEYMRMQNLPVEPQGVDETMIGVFLVVYAAMLLVALLVNLVVYIVYGIGMSGIARREGHPAPWLSWIPVANLFMIPMSVEADVHGPLKGRFTKIFGLTYIVVLALAGVFGFFANELAYAPAGVMILLFTVFFVLCLLPSVLLGYGFYFLVERYSNKVGLNMVIAILSGGFSVPFQLFRYRNRESLYV